VVAVQAPTEESYDDWRRESSAVLDHWPGGRVVVDALLGPTPAATPRRPWWARIRLVPEARTPRIAPSGSTSVWIAFATIMLTMFGYVAISFYWAGGHSTTQDAQASEIRELRKEVARIPALEERLRHMEADLAEQKQKNTDTQQYITNLREKIADGSWPPRRR
jgi:hypothetical protein